MAFKIMARTILELGAELISSDGIALYELIKNSVDAGSRRVRINVQVSVTRSLFDDVLAAADLKRDRSAASKARVTAFLDELDDDVLEEAAADDLRSRLRSVRGADALEETLWSWYDEQSFIEIRDTGHGMSLHDLDNIYLTIGTRSRHRQREHLRESGGSGSAPLGEKGVGRLSTMRLGDLLEVRTSRLEDTHENELDIDWSLFSHSSDAYLEQVDVEPRRGGRKSRANAHGTTVRIRRLKADWDTEKLNAIAGTDFARLVDPFEGDTANDLIRLQFNGEAVVIPEIDRRYLDLAHGTCTARFEVTEDGAELSGSANYALRGKVRTFRLNAAELLSVAGATPDLLETVGPFDMEMWWFNRRILTAVEDVGTQQEIRNEIARWSGGLMLFRDGYRVNPYGSGADDWLALDKRAFASRGYKLNRQQVVGRVRISWRNRGLVDQTNREGLTDTSEKRAFIALLQHIVLVEFKAFIDREDKAARIQERTTLENIEEKIENAEDEARAKLKAIQRLLPQENQYLVEQALRIIKELSGYLEEVKALSDEVANDRAQLVHLAGVGLMVEFIMHELERTTSSTLRTLADINRSALGAGSAAAISTLSDQLKTINKRVANLDPMSTARRQTKESFDVGATIREIVAGHEGKTRRHRIIVDGSFSSTQPWRIKAVRGMFIQILENLLSNSFYWVVHQRELQPGHQPRITINVEPDERVVTVTDNGPGVDPEMASEVFEPFVTRRPAGEGHGLGLYISREVAKYHGWTLDLERASTVRPQRYNTFALDMGGQ